MQSVDENVFVLSHQPGDDDETVMMVARDLTTVFNEIQSYVNSNVNEDGTPEFQYSWGSYLQKARELFSKHPHCNFFVESHGGTLHCFKICGCALV